MKKLLPAYVLSFVTCFMLFIYEPLLMYLSNNDDFWFDIRTLMVAMAPTFLVFFLVIAIVFTCFYFLNKKFFKDKPIYEFIVVMAMIGFIATYIQGNYLGGSLPVLTGDQIVWSSFTKENIITAIVWVVLIGIYIFAVKKFKFENTIKYSMYVVLAIFVMLSTSLIPQLTKKGAFIKKSNNDVTVDNLNVVSSDKNFYIFVVDAVDSSIFSEVLGNSEYKDMLNDFTYFPDTLAAYPFTRDSIPFILSGKWNENETTFLEYYKNAIDSSALLQRLSDENYNLNMYETETLSSVDTKWEISNVKKSTTSDKSMCIIKNTGKYVLFKYLPYFAKKYSDVDNLNYYYCKIEPNGRVFGWEDSYAYNTITNNKLEVTTEKMFKFIHIEGAHVPFDIDENFNSISGVDDSYGYDQKIKASIKIIDAYLKRLKENNAYDNSVIIILGDHGYDVAGGIEGRMNPILYIKGLNEKHAMAVSNKAIAYEDLSEAYMDLLDGKKSTDLFKNIKSERTRRFIWYTYGKEEKMVEYEQTGKANDVSKMKKTGKEFNQ